MVISTLSSSSQVHSYLALFFNGDTSPALQETPLQQWVLLAPRRGWGDPRWLLCPLPAWSTAPACVLEADVRDGTDSEFRAQQQVFPAECLGLFLVKLEAAPARPPPYPEGHRCSLESWQQRQV